MNTQLNLFETAENLIDADGKYSKTIQIPQYIPSEVKPTLGELYNSSKYSKTMLQCLFQLR
jgi:hypothetical protein